MPSAHRGGTHNSHDVSSNLIINLDEVAASRPVDDETGNYGVQRRTSLEQVRSEARWLEQQRGARQEQDEGLDETQRGILGDGAEYQQTTEAVRVSKVLSEVYVLSHLVFFSILGTLARLGLTALNTYPGAPFISGTLWANFTGSLVMGFLLEDRMLFQYDLGITKSATSAAEDGDELDQAAEPKPDDKKAYLAIKKTIPLYIGLATGFCGSLTTFSSFIKDVFLALSNDLVVPGTPGPPTTRNGGYSFMSLLGVIIITVSLSISAIFIGAHLAIAMEGITPSASHPSTRKAIDNLVVLLGWGSWLGAVFMSIFPPYEDWRGRALFSLVFAPLGCLARFYLALWLNGRRVSFPMGTFAANITGTAILGMAWDIAHAPVGGVVGCQVLQGVEDGFCGCLTTISTWVAELSSLRRRHAYVYGVVSVMAALAIMIAIMGGMRWSHGFSPLLCST